MAIEIKYIEYSLPSQMVTNAELKFENPLWDMDKIEEKSGVLQRHIAESDVTALDLAKIACDKLLLNGKIDKKAIKGLIFCTQSPDHLLPSNAFLLQDYLNLETDLFAFDYNLACSGYVYGLAIAKGLIDSKIVENVLLVNADTYSKYINKGDKSTRTLFGDGAAASFIVSSETSESDIIDMKFASSGKDSKSFMIPAGGCRLPLSSETKQEVRDESGNIRSQQDIHMNGFGIWHFISRVVPIQIKQVLKRNNFSLKEIDLFVFHQASKLTLDSLVRSLGIEKNKVFMNLDKVGNCVSASIPLALKDAELEGRLVRGQLVLLSGFGVGLSWGTVLLRY